MSRCLRVLLPLAGAMTVLAFGASTATAAPLQCGDVVTESIELEADLTNCPDDGLVVGADRITIDLNGHEVSTDCEPVDCEGRVGIDNSGGFDRVRIQNGEISGFDKNVALEEADRNTLTQLQIRGGDFNHFDNNSILLRDSDRNVIKDSLVNGGDPAVLLVASDRNKIVRTSIRGGIAIRVGDGLVIADGSDANTLAHSDVDGEAAGTAVVEDSARNTFKKSTLRGHIGALFLIRADRTVVAGNDMNGEQGWGIFAIADRSTIRTNRIEAGIEMAGDRNLVVANELLQGISALPFQLTGGDRNIVRDNSATGSRSEPVIWIEAPSTRTSLIGNFATASDTDGIKVEAPGTLVRDNTANDNDELGINAVDSVIDGGDNHASGNGDPRQCVGVVCTP